MWATVSREELPGRPKRTQRFRGEHRGSQGAVVPGPGKRAEAEANPVVGDLVLGLQSINKWAGGEGGRDGKNVCVKGCVWNGPSLGQL